MQKRYKVSKKIEVTITFFGEYLEPETIHVNTPLDQDTRVIIEDALIEDSEIAQLFSEELEKVISDQNQREIG